MPSIPVTVSKVFTGTLVPAGSTFPTDATFAVTSNDPAVSPTVDATGLVVTGALPAGWVESTTTPLAYSYEAKSASNPSWSLTATITPSAPPFFVIQGTNDTLVPPQVGRRFDERLRAISQAPVAYLELPRAQHAFDVLLSIRTRATVLGVVRFLEAARAARAAGVVARDAVPVAEHEPESDRADTGSGGP